MSQKEILEKVIAKPGIRQAEICQNGNESHMIRQLEKKGCIRRELLHSPRNTYALYPTGEPLF